MGNAVVVSQSVGALSALVDHTTYERLMGVLTMSDSYAAGGDTVVAAELDGTFESLCHTPAFLRANGEMILLVQVAPVATAKIKALRWIPTSGNWHEVPTTTDLSDVIVGCRIAEAP